MSKEKSVKIEIESGEDEIEDVKLNKEEAAQPEEPEEEPGKETGEKEEPQKSVASEEETEEGPDEDPEASEKEEEEEGDDPKQHAEGKKKHFGRKNKKDPRDDRIEELEDRVKRQMAEFENFRKRTDKEKSQMFDMGAKSVIEKILPVIDNFERGLENVPEGCDEAFAEGMNKIYKQMTAELEKIGVKPIEAVGQPFDPNIHNAVMQTESDEYETGTVAQELQKGYMYRDTLIRPSMVSVVS